MTDAPASRLASQHLQSTADRSPSVGRHGQEFHVECMVEAFEVEVLAGTSYTSNIEVHKAGLKPCDIYIYQVYTSFSILARCSASVS